MRGIIRKALKINSWYWIILLSATLLSIWVVFTPHADAITREVIPLNYTEQDITTSQDYQEKEWLKYVKEFCIFKFKSCN